MAKYSSWVGQKISKIMHEGVRRSTRRPVSAKNPRRKVSQKQAIAIALSMARERGLKVPRKKKKRSYNFAKAEKKLGVVR